MRFCKMASTHYQCSLCLHTESSLEGLLAHSCQIGNVSEEIPLVGEDIYQLAHRQPSTSGGSIASNPPGAAESPSVLLERWEDRHVRLLMACYSKFKHLLGKGKTTKKGIFAKIAEEFNSTSDKKVTAEQCIRKWSKLETKHKEIEDNNKLTGRAKKAWKFHDVMTECAGSSPKISPGFTFDTSSSGSSGASTGQCDNGESEDSDESGDPMDEPRRKKRAKMPTRKRKSNSSAAEMLNFLHSCSERREKAEADKLDLLKSMKEEKKEFYSQFIDLLKNK